ncbi:Uncharacterized protein TCM_039345 [Theobroma cacao]|uniref:Uncharacterized protein n=1 Tax=Theobroma cacao TaxID=3641 RepID=A0A061GQ37_THECC|nr:Uncharacterized protein TCM_039345 [Theobroma cacao]
MKKSISADMSSSDYVAMQSKAEIFYKAVEKLESSSADEATREYCVDIDIPLSKGHHASYHHDGEHHNGANDGQHNELGVHIDHDVVGTDGENVTHVDNVLDNIVAGDVTLQSVAMGGDGHFASVQAERDHVPQSTPKGNVLQLSSPKLFDVHNREALISDPTELAQVKMASKYMARSYVDLLVSRRDLKNLMVKAYLAFKKDEHAR